jgi:hypothetical protein
MSAWDAGDRRRFPLLDAAAVEALPRPNFLVEDVLVQGTLAVLYAAPSAGKTFVALDLAFAVATGAPWHGRTVQRGAIVYVAAEGGRGLPQRVRAWRAAHQVSHIDDAWFVMSAVNLLDASEVDAFLVTLAESSVQPVLVEFDTLARCLVGGDENSARDMGIAIAALDRIRDSLGCTVLVLHHTARHHDGERGSGALRGAADMMLLATKDGDTLTIKCDKAKDAPEFEDVVLRLVAADESCVLEEATESKQPAGPSGTARAALRVLADVFDEDGASYTRWWKASKLEETTFGRARKQLTKQGWVARQGEGRGTRYVLTTSGCAALDTATHPHDTRTPVNAGSVITSIHPRASIGSAGDAGDGAGQEKGAVLPTPSIDVVAATLTPEDHHRLRIEAANGDKLALAVLQALDQTGREPDAGG